MDQGIPHELLDDITTDFRVCLAIFSVTSDQKLPLLNLFALERLFYTSSVISNGWLTIFLKSLTLKVSRNAFCEIYMIPPSILYYLRRDLFHRLLTFLQNLVLIACPPSYDRHLGEFTFSSAVLKQIQGRFVFCASPWLLRAKEFTRFPVDALALACHDFLLEHAFTFSELIVKQGNLDSAGSSRGLSFTNIAGAWQAVFKINTSNPKVVTFVAHCPADFTSGLRGLLDFLTFVSGREATYTTRYRRLTSPERANLISTFIPHQW